MESTTEPKWAEQRRWWYSQVYIGLEMVKLLQHREFVILEKPNPTIIDRKAKTIRCCAGYTYNIFKSNLNSFHVSDYPYANLYYSLMHLEKMPLFSFASAARAQSYAEWSNGGYQKFWQSYDLAFDFDGNTIEEARLDLLKVKKIFDEYHIPMSLRFSGSKGFHLCVDSKYLPQLPENKIVMMLGELGTMIKEIDNIPSLDDSIFDSRRVLKLPYSFCMGNVVLPLDDDQLAHFTIDMVKPENVIKSVQIKGRGLLTRYTDQPEEQARASFIKMASQFIDTEKYLGGK